MNIARFLGSLVAASVIAGGPAAAAEGEPGALQNRSIGYVLTNIKWAIHQSPDGKTECPNGYNDGPREQFRVLFPDDGTRRKIIDTQLARETQVWFPTTNAEPFPFQEAGGNISIGLNLDGRTDTNDFVSPDGEAGIDNQMFRALGCIENYRGPNGTLYFFTNRYMQAMNYNRYIVELTEVDSLVNDDAVVVTTYRGLDALLTDATGNDYLPGGSQRVDGRFGKEFVQRFPAKIVGGMLISEPADHTMPATAAFEDTSVQVYRGLRFQLRLTSERAEGLMAGYTDVDNFHLQLNTAWSTHLQSYGQLSSPSLYRAMNRLADGYPDPVTGRNTAISSALEVKFTQVFVVHPNKVVTSGEGGVAQSDVAASQR